LSICDEQGKQDAKKAADIRCLEGHGFAMVGEFQKFMEPYTRGILVKIIVANEFIKFSYFLLHISFCDCIFTYIDTMRRYGMDNWETAEIQFSQHSYDELYRSILDAKIRQGDTQDLARFKRKIDISGHIASAATTFAASSSDDGKMQLAPNAVGHTRKKDKQEALIAAFVHNPVEFDVQEEDDDEAIDSDEEDA